MFDIDVPADPWRSRSKRACAVVAPPLTAGAVIVAALLPGGFDTRGCVGDHPCLTSGEHGVQLGPKFDYDGGTVVATPVAQNFAWTPLS
jgi:hypothetical protein